MITSIPLSLYIHLPWCVRKCPYCDFNSHKAPAKLPETAYIQRLEEDLKSDLSLTNKRSLISVFFGGGTPSLFSGDAINAILQNTQEIISFNPDIEITLEANPGTIEQARFEQYFAAGVNRLSIGIQSFQNEKLKTLGRIHSGEEAQRAIITASKAGFDNFNLDLMFGLPQQTLEDALFDLEQAIAFNPTHISWYQLTLEPNTLFHAKPPQLPNEEIISNIQQAGQALLAKHGYIQYEVSAYAKINKQSRHNMNYWEFGDYLGIGAGAHSKLTQATGDIIRQWKIKNPKEYLHPEKNVVGEQKTVSPNDLPFEFMLNALRLNQPLHLNLFEQRTGLTKKHIEPILANLVEEELIMVKDDQLIKTALGQQYLNNIIEKFLIV